MLRRPKNSLGTRQIFFDNLRLTTNRQADTTNLGIQSFFEIVDFVLTSFVKMALEGIYFSSPKIQEQYRAGRYVCVMFKSSIAGMQFPVFTVHLETRDHFQQSFTASGRRGSRSLFDLGATPLPFFP